MSNLKDKVDEFATIVKSLPENLQAICFELLLRNFLEGVKRTSEERKDPAGAQSLPPESPPPPGVAAIGENPKQHDLKESQLHVKARKFLQKYSLSVDHLNNLFFSENDELKPLYEDLKTTKVSESQIRITLLKALQNAISTGDFEAVVESVRNECRQRKCYDMGNFSATYRTSKVLFDFDEYTKDTVSVRLSDDGKKKLADVIKELQ